MSRYTSKRALNVDGGEGGGGLGDVDFLCIVCLSDIRCIDSMA